MGKNKVNDQEKLDQIDTGLSLDFIVGDLELSLSPLEVDVSISPVVNGPTTISPIKFVHLILLYRTRKVIR